MATGSAFLAKLSAGDETPGADVSWATVWSWCDAVIWPANSTPLAGATNIQKGCVGHLALPRDASVFADVLGLIDD
ncbi:hypothetical protein [Rhabdothermincola sediminis]|uniref:hypothetical protein n=1 Tax=Rhabdothermincola sediminis TaxID=2751370 RepID=UPI001AA0387A|nr:hypothetical protein [Rhabdothermincola sediminis]